jgi:hypothetical protein
MFDRRRRPALEALEDRVVPSITLSMGVLTITGTTGHDAFRISLQPGNSTNIEVSDGTMTQDFALSSVTSVVVNGVAGTDRLTIDESNGFVGNTATGGLPITFNGSTTTGIDTVVLTGTLSGTVTETYTLGPTTGSGKVVTVSGTASQSLTFSHVSSVIDTVAADTVDVTINLGDQDHIAMLTPGRTIDGAKTMRLRGINRGDVMDSLDERMAEQATSSNGDDNSNEDDEDDDFAANLEDEDSSAFPGLTLGNKTDVTINLGNGNNLLIVNLPHAPTGLSSLTVNGGTGTDILALIHVPAGVVVTPTSTPNSNNISRVVTDADDIFIEELFEIDLGRAADEGGLESWKGLFERDHNALEVVQGIERSEEGRSNLVRRLFHRLLNRDADAQGLQGFVNALMNGEREEDIIAAILASPEFLQRAESLFPTVSASEAYVDALYQLVLNRLPTMQESSGFIAFLQANNTSTAARFEVAEGFVESQEFRNQDIMALFANLLNRRADMGGFSAFSASTVGLEGIRDAFEASAEFQNDD